MGIYRVPERVERDGRLIAFAGEIMTEEEAAERELGGFSNPELKEYILEHGGEFKAKATHAELLEIAEGLE